MWIFSRASLVGSLQSVGAQTGTGSTAQKTDASAGDQSISLEDEVSFLRDNPKVL